VFNRVYKKILSDVESKSLVARTIFHWALRYKLALGVERHWLLDKIVFSKICAKLGGNVKIVISGAAPLDPEVLRFLRCVFCCPSVEGYGQTEATAGIAIQSPEDPSCGHVGPPLVGVEVKLQDVPEANINAARDGRGELLVRGPNVFQGYFKNETKTRETVEDKWLKTGDVAEFTSDGQIRIVDRAKAIFKLSQGEYVAPDHLEGVYSLAASVGQIFVDGRSSEDMLVAIVVPAEGVETTGEKVLEELQILCKEKKLKGFERIANLRLVQEEFTEDNGILTSTSKLKRAVARERFATLIDEMYEDLHHFKNKQVS
jgi:long-chain acyl-CoA synthetase